MAEGRGAPALAGLLASIAWVAPPQFALAKDPPKDDRVVCVPAEDGRSWVCGTPDNPPDPRPIPRKSPPPSSSAPPPFLLDPSLRGSGPLRAPAYVPPPATRTPPHEPPPDLPAPNRPATPTQKSEAAPAPPEPAPSARPEAPRAAEPLPSQASRENPAPTPTGVTTAPATEPARAEAAPVAAAPPRVETSQAESPKLETPPAETPKAETPKVETPKVETPKVETPPVESRVAEPPAREAARTGAGVGPMHDAAAFLRMRPERYTVQLARAGSPDGFAALAAELGVEGELYAVPWRQGDRRSWLLFWGEFPDEASAQAALSGLAARERLAGAWPRRIKAMQDELRLSGAREGQP